MPQALPELFTRRIALDDVGSHADAMNLDAEDPLDLEAVAILEDAGLVSVETRAVTERTEGCLAFEAASWQSGETAEAWTPYHGKRGGKGWQKDGQGKPRYQEEKPRDDVQGSKPDVPVVKIDAPGSRQPALFDKLDDGGPTGESEPVAEKPLEVSNIPSAPANKQVKAEPDVKPMEVKTMKRVAKTKSGLDVALEATPRGVSFSVEHPQAGHLAGNLTIWDNAKKVAWTDVAFKGQPVGLSISKSDYDAAKSDVQDAIEADRKDYERTHPGVVERREIADMMRRADYWENNSKYQDFGKAASLRAEARARMDEWKQKYPKEWAEERGNDLQAKADRQRDLATGALLYDADGLLSAADQDRRAEEFRNRAEELERQAEMAKREAGA